jgi:hypothetical protein
LQALRKELAIQEENLARLTKIAKQKNSSVETDNSYDLRKSPSKPFFQARSEVDHAKIHYIDEFSEKSDLEPQSITIPKIPYLPMSARSLAQSS